MDEEFLINIVIAGKKYPLTIKRHEEELAFQLSMHNLELEKRNDTNPFTDKIQELTTELEGYLKK